MIELSAEQREQIQKRQIANALTKLNAGKSLTAREQALLDDATGQEALRRTKFSISELSQLTGRDRRTISSRLENVPFEAGAKGAMLYDSVVALERIYAQDSRKVSLDEARTRQALSQERLNLTRDEELRRIRVPFDAVSSRLMQSLEALVSGLKAHKTKVLTEDVINELLEQFRSIPEQIKKS